MISVRRICECIWLAVGLFGAVVGIRESAIGKYMIGAICLWTWFGLVIRFDKEPMEGKHE